MSFYLINLGDNFTQGSVELDKCFCDTYEKCIEAFCLDILDIFHFENMLTKDDITIKETTEFIITKSLTSKKEKIFIKFIPHVKETQYTYLNFRYENEDKLFNYNALLFPKEIQQQLNPNINYSIMIPREKIEHFNDILNSLIENQTVLSYYMENIKI